MHLHYLIFTYECVQADQILLCIANVIYTKSLVNATFGSGKKSC